MKTYKRYSVGFKEQALVKVYILQPVKFAENEAGIISKFKHNP